MRHLPRTLMLALPEAWTGARGCIGDQTQCEGGRYLRATSELDLGQASRALGPAKYLLDALATALAYGVAGVAQGAPIDGAGAGLGVRRRAADMSVDSHMRDDVAPAQLLDEAAHIVGFVGAKGDPSSAPGPAVQHGQCRFPLGSASSLSDDAVDRQAMAVLHQRMAHVAELGRLAVALLVEPRLRIGSALVGLVGALLLVKAPLGVAAWAVGIVVVSILPTEAL